MRDLKLALRSIAGSKKLSAVIVVTLALGLGANTAVFGVLHAVVLQPLPYPEPDRLVRIYASAAGEDSYLPGPAVLALREASRTLDVAAVYTYSPDGVDLTDRPEPERVRRLPVGADYFHVLGVRPALGRLFDRGDEHADAAVAVVSDRIWREHLGGALDAVGGALLLNGLQHRVAAVLPAGFDDPLEPGIDIWTPLNLQAGGPNNWDNHYLSAIARLRSGATLAQAQAELATIAAGLEWNNGRSGRHAVHVAPLHDDTVGSAGRVLWLLLGAVTVLLVIACVNVASLLLTRGAARETELAVRSALGGSRWRLVRQLLVESLVLSVGGGLAGLVLARVGARALLLAAPEVIARTSTGKLETTVVAFGFGAAVLSGVGFGIAPALQMTGSNLDAVLRDAGRSGSGSRRLTRTRNALVVSQIALALVLLIGAGLLLRSVERLQTVPLGVQTANVVVFEINLPSGRYSDPAQRARFHRDFQARVAALPGVRAVAAVSRLPVTGTYHRWGTSRVDAPQRGFIMPQQRVIEGRYFDALRIPILRGRAFDDRDDERAPRRVVVGQQLVKQLFGDDDPIGHRLRVADGTPEIIGVAGDVAISARGEAPPVVYHSHRQFAADRNWALTQVVALERVSPAILDDIRGQLAAIDPALVLYQPRMLADVVGGGMAQERFALRLVAGFAVLALVLAAVGVYGVLSYSVARRSREMGIRLALGAPAEAVRRLIVGDGVRLAGGGVALGLVGAFAVTRTLRSLLFGVSTTEPAVFAIAALALAAVAIAASWAPARAATRVDPVTTIFKT
ncbi:MAG TPA: ABC transporter permease [Vicinamibacterales bacterium]|nr:ABC transporter permease [Vicinamibacterales bacterium]